MIDGVQKVARAPFTALAREEVRVAIDGVEQMVMVERQRRPRGGWQAYWRCPRCDARRCHLYVLDGVLMCRVCHGLDYRSRHVLHPALIKAAKIRKRLGAAPGVLSALPKRPPHWRSDYWARSLHDLAAAERVIADLLSATVRAAKRQRARIDGQR
jgi:hypothetical protein